MKPEQESKYAESYRVGYKLGHKRGIEDATNAFRLYCQENDIEFSDLDFQLLLEDVQNDL